MNEWIIIIIMVGQADETGREMVTLKGLMKGSVMAKMLRYCSSTKEE